MERDKCNKRESVVYKRREARKKEKTTTLFTAYNKSLFDFIRLR